MKDKHPTNKTHTALAPQLRRLALSLLLPGIAVLAVFGTLACGGNQPKVPQPQKFQITFVGNGGYPETQTMTVEKGVKFDVPAVTRSGHQLIDWCSDKDLRYQVKFPTVIYRDTTYYAWWGKEDKFDEPLALANSVAAFHRYAYNNYCINYGAGESFTYKDNAELTLLLKEAYLDGFSRDKYSENLPFGSAAMHRALAQLRFEFHTNGGGTYHGSFIRIGLKQYQPGLDLGDPGVWNVEDLTGGLMHEVGHHMGLGEHLTSFLSLIYKGDELLNFPVDVVDYKGAHVRPLIEDTRYGVFEYSSFFDYLLLKKVGDKKFWGTVWLSPDPLAAYEKMWDDNLTVLAGGGREALVTCYDFSILRSICGFTGGLGGYAIEPEVKRATGMEARDFFDCLRIVDNFKSAIENNDAAAIEYVRSRAKVAKDVFAALSIRPDDHRIKAVLSNIRQFQGYMGIM